MTYVIFVRGAIFTMKKILMSWSGGKDCSMALYDIQKEKRYEISGLLTTVTAVYDRVSMHGVRRALVEKQSESLGLRLQKVHIPKDSTNKEYEKRMKEVLMGYQKENINCVAFGDIFLEDVRKYREKKLSQAGMKAVFPLWKRNTANLTREFIDLGFKAIVTCVDSKYLDSSFAGKFIGNEFISRLPSNVDPGGENGEFHSFVFDGPIFKKKIGVSIGEVVLRNGLYFCDLLPG